MEDLFWSVLPISMSVFFDPPHAKAWVLKNKVVSAMANIVSSFDFIFHAPFLALFYLYANHRTRIRPIMKNLALLNNWPHSNALPNPSLSTT
jgi:hypothetical protein